MCATAAASLLQSAVQEFVAQQEFVELTLKTITVVVYDPNMMRDYIDTITGDSTARINTSTQSTQGMLAVVMLSVFYTVT